MVQPFFLVLLGIYGLLGVQRGEPPWQIFAFWVIVSVSILVHELGHAFTCRALGVEVHGITLHGLGGHVTRGRSGPGKSLAISLAGPGAGMLLGFTLLGLFWATDAMRDPRLAVIAQQLLWVNIGWSILNLLPMRPLDGGNALLSGLQLVVPAWAAGVTSVVGLACALGLVGLGLLWDAPFLLIFGGLAAWSNGSGLRRMPGDTRTG